MQSSPNPSRPELKSRNALAQERGLEDAEEPQMVVSLSGKTVSGVACGAFHSLVIVSDGGTCQGGSSKGGFYAAGWCLSGQLGLGISTDDACSEFEGVSMPPGAGNVVAASAGYGHSCCLTANGERRPRAEKSPIASLSLAGRIALLSIITFLPNSLSSS